MRLSAMAFVRTKDHSLQGYDEGFRFGMLGLTKTFFDEKLSLTVRGVTPLFSRYLTIHEYSEGRDFISDSTQKVPVQSIGFNISYTFGQMRGGSKKVRHGINNDDVDQNTGGGSIIPSGGGMGM